MRISHVLESALYVTDARVSAQWYMDVFGFTMLLDTGRLCALAVGDTDVLLLFKRGAAASGLNSPGGYIPPHDAKGSAHLAFAIDADAVAEWEQRLSSRHIAVESRVKWDRGGTSLYIRDPDQHSIELATRGTWSIY